MQNVGTAAPLVRSLDGSFQLGFMHHISPRGFTFAALGAGEARGLIGGSEIALHSEGPRAFLCEPQHNRSAFAWSRPRFVRPR
jgi:hypothetical protein